MLRLTGFPLWHELIVKRRFSYIVRQTQFCLDREEEGSWAVGGPTHMDYKSIEHAGHAKTETPQLGHWCRETLFHFWNQHVVSYSTLLVLTWNREEMGLNYSSKTSVKVIHDYISCCITKRWERRNLNIMNLILRSNLSTYKRCDPSLTHCHTCSLWFVISHVYRSVSLNSGCKQMWQGLFMHTRTYNLV